jgi:hypothetical protein
MRSRGAATYLRVKNPLFLFLRGSADVVAAADVAAAAPPAVSAARVASLVSCLAAGAHAPALGTDSSAASAALDEGGEGSHLSGGARPPSLPSSSSPDDEYSSVPGEESSCCSRSRNSSLLRSRRSCRRMLRSLLRAARSCSRHCAARVCARDRGVGGSDRATFTTLICKTEEADEASKHASILQTGKRRKGRTPLTSGPTRSMVNAQSVASSFRPDLRSMARRARVAAYSHREEARQQPRLRQRDGVRVLVHLKDAGRPLHQGDDPPVMEVRENAPRSQAAVRQILQLVQERVQPRLVRRR